ncbi:PmoA family protein [Gryllotalpicola kribbensis]|uniref:PmoA family protein n=1 Tax=Gryllotalpicola kribbensis TaxID=993084 RepID=A0ABP8B0G8_9MICO
MASHSGSLSLLHDVGSEVSVRARSERAETELLRYVYRPTEAQYESPRPYLHPVRTRSGKLVTTFRPHDHVWHKGIALSLPNVGPHNFWGGPTYTRATGYADLGNNGSMEHTELLEASVDQASVDQASASHGSATFSHRLTWVSEPAAGEAAGLPIVDEARTIRAVVGEREDAWTLTWSSTITNVSGAPLRIGSPTTEGRDNAGYGGLFWRGPRSFTGGYMVGADGTEGEELRGTQSLWAGFSGKHDEIDAASTVVVIDGTYGSGLPTTWFARSEPFACLNPAPFFDEARTLEADESLALDYAVVIADGASDAARMSELADAGAEVLAEAGVTIPTSGATASAAAVEKEPAR